MRRYSRLVFATALVFVCGCAGQGGCGGEQLPVLTIPQKLAGTFRSDLVTFRFDEQGVGQSAVLAQAKLLELAQQLGLYDPANPVSRKLVAKAVSGASVVSMQLGVEVPLGVGNLSVELSQLTYDPATGTVFIELIYRVRDANGVEVQRRVLQITIHNILVDQAGGMSASSIEVVGRDGAGNELFRQDLGAAGLSLPGGNSAPEAFALAVPGKCRGGTIVLLRGILSADPDGDTLNFAWSQTAGPGVTLAGAAQAIATFTAPEVEAETTLTFVLTVSDGQAQSSATVNVPLVSSNQVPVARAGEGQTAAIGQTVALNGTASSDGDNDTLTYAWALRSGSPAVSLSGASKASASFVAPTVTEETVYEFELTVSDGMDSSTDIARVVVVPAGVGSLLRQVPADATLVAAIRNGKDIADGVDELTGMSNSVVDILGLDGIDVSMLDRGLAVFFRESDGVAAVVVEAPQVGLLNLLNSFGMNLIPEDAGDGVSKVHVTYDPYGYYYYGEDYGVDIYLAEVGGTYVVLSDTKEHVLAARGPSRSVLERFDASWLSAYNARQLVVYSDGMLPAFLQPMGMGSLLGGMSGGYYYEPEPVQIPDTDGLCVILGVGEPIACSVWQRYEAGSESRVRLQKASTFTGSGLVGLPDEPILLASATRGSLLEGLMSMFSSQNIVDLLIGGSSEGQPDPIAEAMAGMLSLTKQQAFSVSELGGGSAGYVGYANVLEVSDGDATTDDADAYIALLGSLVDELNAAVADMASYYNIPDLTGVIEHTTSTEYVPGRIVHQWKVDLAAVEIASGMDLTPYLPLVQAVLGDEPLCMSLVKIDTNHVAMSMGGGAARLTQIVNSVVAGAAPLAARPLVAVTAAEFPAGRTMEAYVALGQLAKMVYDLGAVVEGQTPTGGPADATTAVGVATSRDGNSQRFDLVVPGGTFMDIQEFGEMLPYYFFGGPDMSDLLDDLIVAQ